LNTEPALSEANGLRSEKAVQPVRYAQGKLRRQAAIRFRSRTSVRNAV